MDISNNKMALLVIDVQMGFKDSYWGHRDTPGAESNISKILKIFRENTLAIYHVQHLSQTPESPLRPGQTGVEFMDFAKPILGERVFQKQVNSAFIGTHLEKALRKDEVQDLVVVGISADHCVSTSVRMAANLDFNVLVVSDATIAFERKSFDGVTYSAELVHSVTLASLHGEFATILTTSDLLEKLGSSK